ncbi:cytoskeleton protein RodZ [Humitalea rosea]|uniref:Cytoskeleton protein RodZ n=2 Tax=Humitalea rosea TaxID=990373 RepID=A0A2W7IE37_9PROT|nr:cytoskeleton protein RodZ [Humitalea rosea]
MKRNARPDLHSGESARVGEELRDARESLGVSLEEMADRLRINRRYIAALEEGRVRDLPGTAYAIGFVRSYAREMGLDADEMIRRFRDGAGAASRPRGELVFPEPVPERGVPAGAVILVGAVLVVGAYVGWYQWSGSANRTVDTVPSLPPRLEETARQGAQLPALPGPGGMPATGTAALLPPSPPAPATPPPAGTTPPGATPASATPAGQAPRSTAAAPAGTLVPTGPNVPAPAAPVAASAPPPATPAVGASLASRITLKAQDECWIQVRDPRSGQIIVNRVLRAGESFQVPPTEGLVLTTGRSQALEVIVDGQVTQALEGRNGVLRDVPLVPDTLKAARPAAR